MEAHIRTHARAILRFRLLCLGGLGAAVVLAAAAASYVWFRRVGAGIVPDGWSDLVWGVFILVLVSVPVALYGALRRTHPPQSPALDVSPEDAPELHGLLADIAIALDVPVPMEVRLSPGCESWVEAESGRMVIVIGSPILWWLRVSELRALLAPLVAAAGLSDDEAVTTARRFIRRLDRACRARGILAPARRPARALLARCRLHAEEMERCVAWAARERAQVLDPAGRVAAHEQADLASAGWHRLLLRVAGPAWDEGLWPQALHTGLVEALDQLAHRDHLAAEWADRQDERPAYRLLARPDRADSELSRMAAILYRLAGPPEGSAADLPDVDVADPGRPVPWEAYTSAVTAKVCRERALAVASFGPPPATPAAAQPSLRGVLRAVAWATGRPGGRDGEFLGDMLGRDVQALLECALVAGGRHRWVLDWLDGSVLVDALGRRVKVAAQATRLVDRREVAGVCAWLAAAGVPVDAPLSASVPPIRQPALPAGTS